MNEHNVGFFFGFTVLLFGLACAADWASKNPEQWNSFLKAVDAALSKSKLAEMSVQLMTVDQLNELLTKLEKQKEYQLCVEVKKVLDVKTKLA